MLPAPLFYKGLHKNTCFYFLLFTSITFTTFAQPSVSFSKLPAKLQLFARNTSNQSTVPISGQITTSGYLSISVVVTRNNVRWQYAQNNLIYQNGKASFFLFPTIQAGLYEYRFQVFAKRTTDSILIADRDSVVCGDAYLVSGQSNARLADDRETYQNQYCRTFGKTTVNGNAGASQLADTLWTLARGNGFVNVGVWPLHLQRMLVEKHQVPICIINGGVSQTKINEHLKNAAAPNYYTNTYYGRLYYRAWKSGLINSFKAFFWYQGESNAEEDFSLYQNSFNQLYYDWHLDYPSLQKIYLFQINIGCTSNGLSGAFREGQRKMKALFPDIKTLATAGTPFYDGCHYDTAGYHFIAKQVYQSVGVDFYGLSSKPDYFSPEISRAYYTSSAYKEIILEFANASALKWQNDTLNTYLKDHFYLDGINGLISSGYASGNKLRLILKKSTRCKTITYLPNYDENPPFAGPCVRNSLHLGAFTFYEFPIDQPSVIGTEIGCPGAFGPVKHVFGTDKKNAQGTPITQNTTWHKDTIYILHDYVRVGNNASLVIEPGTIVMGTPTPIDTAVLIIQKGSKLYANGTTTSPIVFTSCKLQGTRNRGDWGGIVICGNAPNNQGGNVELEGEYKAFHGGTNTGDNSGSLQYVRIEYAGVKFASDVETNGLTLASVGSGTSLKYIQVSFSNDDSFEWFGGTVNGKYLISWKALDDDFDTDLGYSGKNQFGLGFRDYAIADISGSCGFESDNNALSPNASPKTAPTFSNFEVWGPRLTNITPYNEYFKAGAHLRNKTEIKLYNSLFLGWPGDSATLKTAMFLEGAETVNNAKVDSIRVRNCFIGSYLPNVLFLSNVPNAQWSPFASMTSWYYKISNRDSTSNNIQLGEKKAPLKEIPLFTISSPTSRFNRGSSFRTGTVPALPLAPSGFFQDVAYRGAFGGTNWAAEWSEFNPNTVIYTANGYSMRAEEENQESIVFENGLSIMAISPNPVLDRTIVSFYSPTKGLANLRLVDTEATPVFTKWIEIKEGRNNIEVEMTELPKGLYLLSLKLETSSWTGKIIKL